jgi:hypothetical protein
MRHEGEPVPAAEVDEAEHASFKDKYKAQFRTKAVP